MQVNDKVAFAKGKRCASGVVLEIGERFVIVRVDYADRGMGYKAGDKAAVPVGMVQPFKA